MQATGIQKRRFTRWPWSKAADSDERHGAPSSTDELRQRCLQRLVSQDRPLWSDEPDRCDGCGRELSVDERALLMCRGEELLLACPRCAERLLGKGYLAVTADAGTEAPGEQGFSLAS